MSKTAGIDRDVALRRPAADPPRGYDRVLFELSMSDAVTSGHLGEALHEICGTASHALDVRRTNVWLFDTAHTMLSEAVTFSRDPEHASASLAIAANPSYFEALQRHRVIAADDVNTDPRTAGFCTSYFHPRGITATLDAPIRLHGRLLGVICHEHTGGTRLWDAEEERFAASLADLVALALVADQRAQALRAVRESEARFRCLVDGVRDLIFELDPVGTIISVSRAIASLLGFAPDAWAGRHFSGLIVADDLPRATELFDAALSGREVPVFEIRVLHADGHAVWIEFMVSVEGSDESVQRVFGVGRDVTARRQIDARRRALIEIGQALTHCGDDVAGVLAIIHEQLASALEADVVTTALCAPATSGRPLEHVCTVHAPELADADAAQQLVERALALDGSCATLQPDEDGPASIGCPLRTQEGVFGAIVAWRTARTPFSLEQLDLLQHVGREIALALAAARHRREAAETAALSGALARVGQVLITSVNLPVLLEHLCRVTTEELGCDTAYAFLRDDAVGGFVRMASHGDPPQVDEALRAVPLLDSQVPELLRALERDGILLAHASDGAIPAGFWDAYGTRSSVAVGLRHGTRLVGALAASYRRDEPRFGARQIRIAQGIAQLAPLAIVNAQLVGELEAAGRIKSDFVATMSHELRTPLNVILGYTDLLLLDEFGVLTLEQADTLRRVRGSAEELHELIEATLDLSRLESGTVALRIEEVDLAAWLEEVRAETAALRERNPHVDVRFALSAPSVHVATDALKLKVILKNLIGNALKFTAEGSVTVDVTVSGAAIVLTVSDTGIGMEPDVQAVIFEAFRQGDTSSTRPYGGVGLGLYIVRRLVDALRGRITVASEPGRGSEFRVELPLDPRNH
jgi:PAS domain S-box-containing protein